MFGSMIIRVTRQKENEDEDKLNYVNKNDNFKTNDKGVKKKEKWGKGEVRIKKNEVNAKKNLNRNGKLQKKNNQKEIT